MDSIKITSTVSTPKVNDIPSKHTPGDSIFDINNLDEAVKITPVSENYQKESFRETLFQNLQKEILKPLMNSTTAEADALRKLVLISELFESSANALPKELLDGLFINSQDLLSELMLRDKTDSIFKGTFFDSLRALAKLDGYPQLKESIVSILRHYDAYVNRNNTLNGIFLEASRLLMTLPSKERAVLDQQLANLEAVLSKSTPEESDLDKLLNQNNAANKKGQTSQELQNLINLKAAQNGKLSSTSEQRLSRIEALLTAKNLNYQEIQQLLKNETIPALRQILQSQAYSEKTYQSVATIIDHIVRYDKGNPEQLEAAVLRFSQALKPLSSLTDNEIVDMKNQLFLHAKEAEILSDRLESSPKNASDIDKVSLSQLLEKALDDNNSNKIINSAQSLLQTMVRNESPIFTLMHFLIPLRFLDENSYGEFFVDKDPTAKKGEKGSSEEATDIFFTIQSDRYGNFEVELLARDKKITLNIKSPAPLVDILKSTKEQLKTIVEEQGYSLAGYGVGEYLESQTILQRFPKLAFRKVGLDVSI
ncbi:hypothetical protein [Acetobacterium woodii]|uniref:Uncharacterized protein n=1 Tax=Acetobacterium woodii (strain ATCC 29683 / DSM 1030 / JCM 2381 / KCTC 1655 / WB1) TaxID=931626 RepID=H6LDR3_ACEWD|nr:hypothetical protein [Acetobacterium woodii]AFA49227.1 hypothetical protein Awo_c24700 [Acetobacterium woodii DSM 1030]